MKILYISLLFLFCLSCQKISHQDELSNQEMFAFAKEVKKERGLRLIGFGGGSADKKLTHLSLTFSSLEYPDIDEARWIYFNTATRFIDRLNQNQDLQSYFSNYPLTVFQNLDLMILFSDSTTSIVTVSMSSIALPFKRESVMFMSLNPSTKKIEVVHRERFEDSLRLYEEQKMNRDCVVNEEPTN